MPDSRSHRGAHPEDAVDFAAAQLPKLCAACEELSWLMERAYAPDGRTRALFAACCEAAGVDAAVELTDRVDAELVESKAVVASSDSWILDRATQWVDLPSALLPADPGACWLLPLG